MVYRSAKTLFCVGSLALVVALAAISGGVSAQIQLSPPPLEPQTWAAQLAPEPVVQAPAQPKAGTQPQLNEAKTPAATHAPQPAQPAAEPAKPAPPDFSIVDRATGVEAGPKMAAWTDALNQIEQLLTASFLSYTQLDNARGRLEQTRNEIDQFLDVLSPKVGEAKAQFDNLGPAPQNGEPEPVVAQRAELGKVFGSLSAAKNIADSAKLRSNQLSGRVQEIRRRKFADRLFERVPEAHDAYTWQNAPSQLVYAIEKSWQIVAGWWGHLDQRDDAMQLIYLTILLAAATTYLARRGVRRFRHWDEPDEPPFWRRSTSAAWVILLRILPVSAASAFAYYSFDYQELITGDIRILAYSLMRSLLIVTSVSALVTTALAPSRPHWRLVPMEDRAASRIRWLVVALGVVYSLTLFLSTVRYVSNAPFTLTVAQSFTSSIIMAGLVMAIMMTKRNAPEAGGGKELAWIARLRLPVWTISLVILVTALFGYISLARFISTQLIVTGTVLSVLYLLTIWGDAVGESMADENAQFGRWLKENAGLDQRRREQLAVPVTLALKFLVALIGLPLVLLQWGFDRKDIIDWGEALLFGWRIGHTEISLAAILAAIVVFVLGYFLARFIQDWLDRRVLATAGISGGARNSISTAIGYAGFVIAALFAISYAGLDLSNVALVAGALSVGIGLGLQGVVNNFVSGMILLVERPIKVGDWVVVGGEEGIVKKISVRSTEIETFDRANVLIPNSYFISEKVKNWTLHNYSGRITIAVGVHYRSDPRRVREILLRVAQSHAQVMTNPEPAVYFEDFGADALNFKLYVYVYDITKTLALRTDLRIDIFETFRNEGIEIPYRQTDMHVHGLDWLKGAVGTPLPSPQNDDPATAFQQELAQRRKSAGS